MKITWNRRVNRHEIHDWSVNTNIVMVGIKQNIFSIQCHELSIHWPVERRHQTDWCSDGLENSLVSTLNEMNEW